ncbi:hypothetical protein [Desulfotomaculum sp. 1211_IL3151]|uniref:hypothetical protein n=1 Tax=Desulfotomaculum sp. 1211_IL3151 TaxID=3084055 RepID=UPI002FDAFBAF
MWVYYLTLVTLSLALYFINKKVFTKLLALKVSFAVFLLGMLYPRLQAELPLWKTVVCLGLLMLLSSFFIAKRLPQHRTASVESEPCQLDPSPETVDATTEEDSISPIETNHKDLTNNIPPIEEVDPQPCLQNEPLAQPNTAISFSSVYSDSQQPELTIPAANEPAEMKHEPIDIVETSEVVTPPKEQPPADIEVTPQSLLTQGIRFVRLKQYALAVRSFNKIFNYNPSSEILYLTIGELSSLYQYIGLYPMASDIIQSFMTHPDLQGHPGLEPLKAKLRFIQCLNSLLTTGGYHQIPYEQVPEAIRREAYINSLN